MTLTRINRDMARVFSRYHGDADAWARSKHRDVMTDAEWRIINDFVQDLHLVRSGLASKEFAESLRRRMDELCEDETVIEEIRELPG